MRPYRVGLDARMWDHPGIGRYIRELYGAMRHLPFDGALDLLRPRSAVYSVGEQFELPWRARGCDLLHVPHFNIPVLYPGRLVATVHDLIYLKEPDALQGPVARSTARFLLRTVARKAAAVLVVSESTKNDLLELFPFLPAARVVVTPEAVSSFFRVLPDAARLEGAKRALGLERPFVLFVGTLKPHKNLPCLLKAMSLLRGKRKVDHELVVVGRPDKKNAALLAEVRRHSFVRYLGELPDERVLELYNLAEAFVLPSFREGFGLPVLEAMACGTPVIAARRSSLPEVVGEAGFLFEAGDVDALSDLLYDVLSDRGLRRTMREKGFQNLKRFSWEETARRTLRVYEEVLR